MCCTMSVCSSGKRHDSAVGSSLRQAFESKFGLSGKEQAGQFGEKESKGAFPIKVPSKKSRGNGRTEALGGGGDKP